MKRLQFVCAGCGWMEVCKIICVVSVRAVLAVVVLLDEEWVHRGLGIECEGDVGHLGTLLHHLGIVNGVGRTGSP